MSSFTPNVFPRATAMVHEEHIYTDMHTHADTRVDLWIIDFDFVFH